MTSILKKTVIFVALFFLGLILLINIYVDARGLTFLYLAPFVIFIPILYILNKHLNIKDKHFALILFAVSFLSKALVVIFFNTPPASDFQLFYKAAIQASNGDFSFSTSGYFNVWGYQTGIVLFYAAIVKIFGTGLLPIKFINCLFMAGVNLLVYCISRIIVSERTSRFISLLYLIYPAPYFLAPVLTNQHISNFFLYAGLYVYMRKGNKIFAVFLIALGNAMRPQGIVIIASIAALQLLEYANEKAFKKNAYLSAVFVVALYFLIGQAFSQTIRITGVNENGLQNTFPEYKFVVGLNHETKGTYSTSDARILMSITDRKERTDKSIEMIKDRLSRPSKVLKLMLDKQKKMWGDLDSSFGWGFNYLEKDGVTILGRHISYYTFKTISQKLEKQVYILALIFALTGVYSLLDSKEYDKNIFLMTLMVSANFVIYSLIEIQARYRDFAMIAIFIIASKGIELTQNRLLSSSMNKPFLEIY